METTPDIALSVIVPYFKKITDLRRVLPNNARYLGRREVELVLVLDEPSEEDQVLALLDRLPLIRARVIVNDRPHEWRPPCVAINVGLRAARGKYVLVVSPESLFVDDVPLRVLRTLARRPTDVVTGRIGWATYAAARSHGANALFEAAVAAHGARGFAADYYGSIAAARDLFMAVRGYDESLTGWGGDDDNIRARLSINGALLVLDRGLRLVHLSSGPPQRDRLPPNALDKLREQHEIANPASALANPGEWGVEFGRVARDWQEVAVSPAPHGDPVAAAPSGRVQGERISIGRTGRSAAERPDVVAVFSFRYDAHLVPDLIANLEPVVDAWVAYDDRDSEALFSNEARRRRLLLQAAHGLGARWVLAIDPDERVEHALADKIDEMTRSMEPICWSFALREMYGADRYRYDGIWGRKEKGSLFPLRGDLLMSPLELHGPWSSFPMRSSGFNLYHLKMIEPLRRKVRSELYSFLDPDNRYQEIGYDYLADETGVMLESIPEGRGYLPVHHDDGELWMPRVSSSD